MKLETVKSVTLAILIGISLLLTLGLWSYQPNYKFLSENYAEADIGGKDDVQKKDLVKPASFIFHQYDQVYGFSDPQQGQKLYHDMQEWTMGNLTEKTANGPPKDNNRIELIFPDRLPMELLDSLFTFDDDTEFPAWSFQRMFITFNQNSSLEMEFLSVNGNKRATAVINNTKKYDRLWTYMTKQDELSEYTAFNKTGPPIYIPKHSPEMKQRKVTKKDINPSELVDVLFNTPEAVRQDKTKAGELYYTDGFRGMRVKGDGDSIEYFNPLNDDFEQMDPVDLLETSRRNINEQKGWTGDFSLDALDPSNNTVRYRMYYAGYPVFNYNLARIEQEWHGQDLYKYKRPIVRFSMQPEESAVEMESGEDVIHYIKNKSNYNAEDVEDIKLGYHLTGDESNTSFYLAMEPVWYLKYNDNWRELNLEDTDMKKERS